MQFILLEDCVRSTTNLSLGRMIVKMLHKYYITERPAIKIRNPKTGLYSVVKIELDQGGITLAKLNERTQKRTKFQSACRYVPNKQRN